MTRLLCLGDSYTIGEGIDADRAWPRRIAELLRVEVQVIAVTGWTIDDLLAGMSDAGPIDHADLVTVLIGVNDQYDATPFDDVAGRFEFLLDEATSIARGRPDRVVCITIPDWSLTPFAADRERAVISSEIEAYNDAIRTVATRRGHRIADLTPLQATLGALVAADGLHPSEEVHAAWADGPIAATVKSALASTDT